MDLTILGEENYEDVDRKRDKRKRVILEWVLKVFEAEEKTKCT